MSGTRIPLIAWDSCVFLAWFNREADKDLAIIHEILSDVAAAKTNLLVSVVCKTEVLDTTPDSTVANDFRGFVKRSSVVYTNVDDRIAEMAARCRERAKAAKCAGEIRDSIKAPDAIIIANAIIYRADVLHTYDPAMLALSKKEIVAGLEIIRPAMPGGVQLLPMGVT